MGEYTGLKVMKEHPLMKQSAWQTVMGILLLGIVALVSWQAGTLVAVQNLSLIHISMDRHLNNWMLNEKLFREQYPQYFK